jgi:PIN domain nuclease of toxin-antitoxin system
MPMNVLLDTCALIALGAGSLPTGARQCLETAPDACVSLVSPWELAIKVATGKLTLKEPVESWFTGLVDRYKLRVLPLELATVCAAAALPPIHRDPFDRVLIVIATHRRATLLTSDRIIPSYPGITTLW